MQMRYLGLFGALASATLLAACATVSSQHIGEGVPLRGKAGDGSEAGAQQITRRGSAGVAYFLPRQLARVTATRTGGVVDESVQKVVRAQSEVESAQAAIDRISAAIRQTEELIIAGTGGANGLPILNARLAGQRADLVAANVTLSTSKTALETAKTELVTTTNEARRAPPGPGSYKVALKIELLAPSADPSQGFLLSPQHTPFRDDEHQVVVARTGLLTSTNTVAADRTADILLEIATFAGAVVEGPVGLEDDGPDEELDCSSAPSDVIEVVDFVNAASVAALNADLQCLGVRMTTEGQYWPADTRPTSTPTRGRPQSVDGIVYRTPVEVQVRVERCTNRTAPCSDQSGWFPTEVIALSLPQAGPISYVRQDSGFMTRSRYTLAFQDGILTSYDASRPSELLEVARTPMRLVNSLFDGMSRVISLRTGQNNSRAGLSTSELALLNAQVALQAGQITGRRTLSEAELALLRAQFALQAGTLEGQRTLSAAELALLQQQIALQAGSIEGRRTLSAAELALLQQQIALQAGTIEGQRTLSAAELALLQQQFALQSGTLAGQTGLTNAELALIQAQSGLALGRNNATAQLSTSELTLMATLIRNQARRETLSRCVSQQLQASLPIDSCLTGF